MTLTRMSGASTTSIAPAASPAGSSRWTWTTSWLTWRPYVPQRMPPPDMLTGIRRAIAADAASEAVAKGGTVAVAPWAISVEAPPEVVAQQQTARQRPSRVPLLATIGIAAVFGVLAVGLGGRAASLQGDLDVATAQVTSLEAALAQQASAVTVAMNPAHVTVALHAEPAAPAARAAVMFVPGSTSAYIVAEDLPATPDGHGYQLWYADADGVHGLQTVSFDGSGPFVAPLGVDLAQGTAVMITLEGDGGAQGEPGPQVVFGEL